MTHPHPLRLLGGLAALGLLSACDASSPQGSNLSSAPSSTAGPGLAQPQSLVGHWSFDEGAGLVAADSSLYGNDAKIAGTHWIPGQVGSAIGFNGGGDVAGLLDHVPAEITSLEVGTVSLWFRFEKVPGPNLISPLLHLGDTTGGARQSGLEIEVGHFESNTKLYFTLYSDNGVIPLCFDSNFNLQLHHWYHFAAVVGPDHNTGYLDGVELTGRHYNFGTAQDSYFLDDIVHPDVLWFGRGFLGKVLTTQEHFGGIDEVQIHRVPLTGAEIAAYYADTATSLPLMASEPPRLRVEERPGGDGLVLSVTNAEPHGPVQAIARLGGIDWPLTAPVTADVFGAATIEVAGSADLALGDVRVEAANGSSRDG